MNARSGFSFITIVVLLFGALLPGPRNQAYAATASVPSLGSAIGLGVLTTAVANGFSAADPRIAETAKAIGAAAASLASAAASAAGVAAGNVAWGTVLASAGLGVMLASVPTSLGNDTLQQWQFNHDGTVTVSSGSGSGGSVGSSPFPALTVGHAYYAVALLGQGEGGTPDAAFQAAIQLANGTSAGYAYAASGCDGDSCSGTATAKSGGAVSTFVVGAAAGGSWSGSACSSGLYYSGACQAYVPPVAPPPPPVTEPVSAAVAGVSVADQADDLNDMLLAASVNALWSQAATGEGYAGLPYPVNSPMTPAQASSVEAQLGASAPTVGSFVSPAGSTGGSGSGSTGGASTPFDTSVPVTSNPATSTPAATNPGTGAQVNLGPDPGIGSPSLEQTPTASQILAPILNMLPGFQNFSMPAHTAQCPAPTFVEFGRTFTMDTQCALFERFRPQIYAGAVLAFTLLALIIVLSA